MLNFLIFIYLFAFKSSSSVELSLKKFITSGSGKITITNPIETTNQEEDKHKRQNGAEHVEEIPQAFDIPGVLGYAEASNMVRNLFSMVRYEVLKRMETPPDYPHTINFMFTKYPSLTPRSSFI